MDTSRNPSRNIATDLRIVGVDDGTVSPSRKTKQWTLLVAVLFQGLRLSNVRIGRIQVDGRDANKTLFSLLRGLRFDVVMLSGISFAGFNLVDIDWLSRMAHKPVIAISGEKPDNSAVLRALQKHFTDWKGRWRNVRAAGKLYSCKPLVQEPQLYYEIKGASQTFARNVIHRSAVISRLPEPIRVAGIIAKGLSQLTQKPTLP